METIDALVNQLVNYNRPDLAAGVGAIQLVAENADHLLRIEQAVLAIKSLPADPSASAVMSNSRWRSLLNSPPLADIEVMRNEDPFEELYVSPVAFYGGSYLCMPGLGTNSVGHAQRLLDAVFQIEPRPPESIERDCFRMVLAVLTLSDKMARAAELVRYQKPGATKGYAVVPPKPQFLHLKDAVRISWIELAYLVGHDGAGLLRSLCTTLSSGITSPRDGDQWGDTSVKPIIDFGDELVVAVPGGLMSALRHWIVLRFQADGLEAELGLRYRAMVARTARRALAAVGAGSTEELPSPDPLTTNYGIGIDTNVALHLAIVSDDLSGYEANQPFGRWPIVDGSARLQADLEAVRTHIREDSDQQTAVLHLIVVEGIGRFSALGLTEGATDDLSHTLLTNVDDLTTICEAEPGDALALWKFARAGDHLRVSTMVMQWSLIDEYELYRAHEDSFYLGDDERPSLISLETAYGLDLKIEQALAKDLHFVRHPVLESDVGILRRYNDGTTPVYATDPLNPPVDYVVEDGGTPVAWILIDREHTLRDRMLGFELTELMAYWTWQISRSLPELTPHSANPLCIVLKVDEGEEWKSPPQPVLDDTWLSVEADPEGAIAVHLTSLTAHALSGPTNEGERVIVRELIRALAQRASSPTDLEELLNQVAPLGLKKKIAFLDSRQRFALTPGENLDPTRLLRKADTAVRLDEAGAWLSQRYPCGEIAETDRVELLNALVKYHFEDLSTKIKGLDGRALLARLMSQHESLLQDNALHDLNLPTRQACFGQDAKMMEEAAERSQLGVASAIASRFLIEFVAAEPPQGAEPTGRLQYDHLLSIASEIVSKGLLSDGIHFQIADTQLSMLASGRLGIDRDGRFQQALDTFRDVRFAVDFEDAAENYRRHWDQKNSEPAPSPAVVDFNEAFKAEFGILGSEWADFIGESLRLGLNLGAEPARMPLPTFLDAMASGLRWPVGRVQGTLRMAALESRADFLEADRLSDILPWKFGRDLSYMRRPFILLSEPDEVLWGVRHTERSGGYLVGDLCLQGRLKAKSAEMRKYIGIRRSTEPEYFNDLVADAFEGVSDLVVHRRIDRFNGKRVARQDGTDLGDIDVLVVDTRARRIIAVECKDFLTARTPSELQRELRKLVSGPKATVLLHGERVDWLKRNLGDVLEAVLPGTKSTHWRVSAQIVVSRASMSPLLADSRVPIVSLRELRSTLGRRHR